MPKATGTVYKVEMPSLLRCETTTNGRPGKTKEKHYDQKTFCHNAFLRNTFDRIALSPPNTTSAETAAPGVEKPPRSKLPSEPPAAAPRRAQAKVVGPFPRREPGAKPRSEARSGRSGKRRPKTFPFPPPRRRRPEARRHGPPRNALQARPGFPPFPQVNGLLPDRLSLPRRLPRPSSRIR